MVSKGFIYLFRKLLKIQSHPLNRHSILSLKKYAKINELIIRDMRGLDYLPLRTGGVIENKKNKVIEKKIRKSPLKYFGNEIMLLLVKKRG